MAKTCKNPNCNSPVFSNGLCKYCVRPLYAKRAKERRRKKRERGLSKHQKRKQNERAAMRKKWEKSLIDDPRRPYCVCENCSVRIYLMQPGNIAHIVSKGALNAARCDLENLAILCLNCHFVLDNDSNEKLEPLFQQKINETKTKIKAKYSKF